MYIYSVDTNSIVFAGAVDGKFNAASDLHTYFMELSTVCHCDCHLSLRFGRDIFGKGICFYITDMCSVVCRELSWQWRLRFDAFRVALFYKINIYAITIISI